jgi:hypothetical protein
MIVFLKSFLKIYLYFFWGFPLSDDFSALASDEAFPVPRVFIELSFSSRAAYEATKVCILEAALRAIRTESFVDAAAAREMAALGVTSLDVATPTPVVAATFRAAALALYASASVVRPVVLSAWVFQNAPSSQGATTSPKLRMIAAMTSSTEACTRTVAFPSRGVSCMFTMISAPPLSATLSGMLAAGVTVRLEPKARQTSALWPSASASDSIVESRFSPKWIIVSRSGVVGPHLGHA